MDYVLPYLPESVKNIPTHMDFDGQKRAERYFQIIIVIFAIVGFGWGFVTQMFSQTLYILFAGVFVSSMLTLVPWSMYRKQPLQWQAARDPNTGAPLAGTVQSQPSAGSTNKTKKKKLRE